MVVIAVRKSLALTRTECQSSLMSEYPDWSEMAAGVYRAVIEPDTVNCGLVVGADAALLIDTGSTAEQGRNLRAAIAEITDLPLTTVVVTHGHDDHALGLAAFADLDTLGHESLAAALEVAPSRPVVVAAAVDLGGRRVEVAHLGRGHTDGDLVVVVADADLVFVGDLVESAGPPQYGPDCYPHEWAETLDGVIGLMTERTRAVPGHGDPVDRKFVFEQRGRIATVSGQIRHLVETGVAEDAALARGDWPFPKDAVAAGISPGYAQLGGERSEGVRPTLPMA